jgi:RNA polymerase sigma factor (TIGR02999 family)
MLYGIDPPEDTMPADHGAPTDTVATLIAQASAGDRSKSATLFAELYRELHRAAARQLRVSAAGATLSATTLLHECYLDMSRRDAQFPDASRFIAYAARAMRGLIIDYVRERRALKRGGAFHLTTLDTQTADAVPTGTDLVRLSDALASLEEADPALAALVDLKFFCGFSFAEIAAMREVSERTIQRDWQKARLVLHDTLKE